MSEPTRILMTEEDIPTHWYNIAADMPNAPLPPLGPDGSPATPDELRKRFDALISERGKGKDATKLRFVIE